MQVPSFKKKKKKKKKIQEFEMDGGVSFDILTNSDDLMQKEF